MMNIVNLWWGGAVFFAKPKVKYNWINDLDKELVSTYRVMQDARRRTRMIQRLENEKATRSRHMEIKCMQPTSELGIACRYFFINRTSYSGMMKLPPWGYSATKSVPPSRWGSRISESGSKLEGVRITSHDFSDVINAPSMGHAGTFMFIDPPYYKADQKRAYVYPFQLNDHIRLAKSLRRTKHKFCLTYDDCEETRNLYSWAFVTPVSWRYHVANSNKTIRGIGNELLITNFDVRIHGLSK